jgi:hypothetical protein
MADIIDSAINDYGKELGHFWKQFADELHSESQQTDAEQPCDAVKMKIIADTVIDDWKHDRRIVFDGAYGETLTEIEKVAKQGRYSLDIIIRMTDVLERLIENGFKWEYLTGDQFPMYRISWGDK